MNDFISKISAILDELEPVQLKPVPDQPTERAEYEIVNFDSSEKNNAKWKALIADHVKTAKHFEIHCWTEEQEEIAMALQYGTLRDSNWKHGKVIAGVVTTEFAAMLLNLPKPVDTVFSDKVAHFSVSSLTMVSAANITERKTLSNM